MGLLMFCIRFDFVLLLVCIPFVLQWHHPFHQFGGLESIIGKNKKLVIAYYIFYLDGFGLHLSGQRLQHPEVAYVVVLRTQVLDESPIDAVSGHPFFFN